MNNDKAKPTPGPWTLTRPGRKDTSILGDNGRFVVGGEFDGLMAPFAAEDVETSLANADLIAEAGTVYHEVGLTPREILAQRDSFARIAQKVGKLLRELTKGESCDHAVGICFCEVVNILDEIDAVADLLEDASTKGDASE